MANLPMCNCTLAIDTNTGRELWSAITFPGKVRESKVVDDELSVISETTSPNELKTEFRKIALANGTVMSYNNSLVGY